MSEPGRFIAVRLLVVEDEKKTASFIRKALQAEGIPMSPGYPYPLYRNPLFTGRALHSRGCPAGCEICARGIDYSRLNLPAAEQACIESVWLEHQLFLGTASDVDDILEAIDKVRAGADRVRAIWEERHAHA